MDINDKSQNNFILCGVNAEKYNKGLYNRWESKYIEENNDVIADTENYVCGLIRDKLKIHKVENETKKSVTATTKKEEVTTEAVTEAPTEAVAEAQTEAVVEEVTEAPVEVVEQPVVEAPVVEVKEEVVIQEPVQSSKPGIISNKTAPKVTLNADGTVSTPDGTYAGVTAYNEATGHTDLRDPDHLTQSGYLRKEMDNPEIHKKLIEEDMARYNASH